MTLFPTYLNLEMSLVVLKFSVSPYCIQSCIKLFCYC